MKILRIKIILIKILKISMKSRKIVILSTFLKKMTILRKILRIRLILRIRIFVNTDPGLFVLLFVCVGKDPLSSHL